MPTPSLTDGDHLRVIEKMKEGISAGCIPLGMNVRVGQEGISSYVGRTIGLSRDQARVRCNLALARFPEPGMSFSVSGPAPAKAQNMAPDGMVIASMSGAYNADGELERQWIGTKRAPGEDYTVPAGHVVKGESVLLSPDNRVIAKWIKTKEGGGEGLIEALQAAFAAYDGAAPLIAAPAISDADLLTVYPLPDLHFGMYSYGRETGADYDTEIAGTMARRTISALVARAEPSERAIILGLGDLFHADSQRNATPGSGHQLDVDGRWSRTFALGARLMTDLIDIALQKHKIVSVVILPGNHDVDSSVCLRVALSLFYSANPRVDVYDEPGIVWADRFGLCLLGATHGHTMRMDRMAMVLATDYAKDWGETTHRAFFSGHIHTETAREIGSVRLESLSSPAARDAWNAASGYRSGRALQAITYHKEHGEIGRNRVNIVSPVAGIRPRIRIPARAA